jgi:hypothetical protein
MCSFEQSRLNFDRKHSIAAPSFVTSGDAPVGTQAGHRQGKPINVGDVMLQ